MSSFWPQPNWRKRVAVRIEKRILEFFPAELDNLIVISFWGLGDGEW
jgi:hypothetical protein